MPQKEIELILLRQLASYLATPILIVDPKGNLLFYNEHAEAIIGRRYEETGEMTAEEWTIGFKPTDRRGKSMPPEAVPLMIALNEHRPAHGSLWIRGLDGVRRRIETTAFPLIGQEGRFMGAVSVFWETQRR